MTPASRIATAEWLMSARRLALWLLVTPVPVVLLFRLIALVKVTILLALFSKVLPIMAIFVGVPPVGIVMIVIRILNRLRAADVGHRHGYQTGQKHGTKPSFVCVHRLNPPYHPTVRNAV